MLKFVLFVVLTLRVGDTTSSIFKSSIKYAVSISKVNDILLILGKGHEKYQIVGDKKIEFSDSEVLKNYLKIAV